jgi:hypothetical protein
MRKSPEVLSSVAKKEETNVAADYRTLRTLNEKKS